MVINNLIDQHRAEKGYTIVEVLIAMSVFSIGLLGIAALQSSSIESNSGALIQTQLTSWCSDRVESLIALPYSDPALAQGATDPPRDADGIDNDGDGITDETDEAGNLNSISWVVQDNRPFDNTKTITVEAVTTRKGGSSVVIEAVKRDVI